MASGKWVRCNSPSTWRLVSKGSSSQVRANQREMIHPPLSLIRPVLILQGGCMTRAAEGHPPSPSRRPRGPGTPHRTLAPEGAEAGGENRNTNRNLQTKEGSANTHTKRPNTRSAPQSIGYTATPNEGAQCCQRSTLGHCHDRAGTPAFTGPLLGQTGTFLLPPEKALNMPRRHILRHELHQKKREK